MKTGSFDRKAQIVFEATRLFGQDGYEKVTIKQLADACGVTEPAIYRHFESKEAIYEAVLQSLRTRMDPSELFGELEKNEDIEPILRGLARHIIEYFIANQDIHRLLLYSTLRDQVRGRQVFDVIRGTYVRFLMNQLDRLYERKVIIRKNNEITARCFVGMVFDCALNVTLWKGMLGKNYLPADVIENNVPIYAKGLKP
ncbi:MAG: TetR/AcrR family transcriptional regulator [candidate division Zixibacteria bacterium]|nr:TetR/AcrR family transcriptional regulator [candidate division Zixibacteria bacterium]